MANVLAGLKGHFPSLKPSGDQPSSIMVALRRLWRSNKDAPGGDAGAVNRSGVTVVTSSEQLANARGRIILVGPEVSASLEPPVPDQRWRFQPPRELRKWQPLQPKASQFLNISIHRKMADALRQHRFKDIRFGYDGYRRWLLSRTKDTVLIAGVRRQDGLWVTEIAYINSNIVSVRERRIDVTADSDQRYQVETLISDARSVNPRASIVLAIDGLAADPSLNAESIGGAALLLAPAASLKLGYLSLNLKLATPPALVAISALGFCGYTLYDGHSRMMALGKQYRTAIAGIENEYKEGMKLINVLEARNVYMGEQERKPKVSGRAEKILRALPTEGGPLLQRLSVSRDAEGKLSFTLVISVIPEKDMDPIAQAEPFVRGLAAGLNTDVSLSDFNDVVINSISNRLKFRQLSITGRLPDEEEHS